MCILKQSKKFPFLTEFLNTEGNFEIGYIYEMGISAIAYDEGGTIWEGKKRYDTLEDLLVDAEEGVKKWIKENW